MNVFTFSMYVYTAYTACLYIQHVCIFCLVCFNYSCVSEMSSLNSSLTFEQAQKKLKELEKEVYVYTYVYLFT